jgi:formyltetrahydrofolate deformylase
MQDSYVLTVKCPDRTGIVAAISTFVFEHGGWITEAHHHSDEASGVFFTRQEVRADSLPFGLDEFRAKFAPIAERFEMQWQLRSSATKQRVVVLSGKLDHCLSDILHRVELGEFNIEIPCVISNHQAAERMCQRHDLPFHHVPMDADKASGFAEIERLIDSAAADVIVLARFMQILPPELCRKFTGQVINIHHGFLPSFSGARPYHRAYEHGVKLIGATCHYVTDELDAGPIIDQDVVRVHHGNSVSKMVALGRDVERTVLSRGLGYHLEDRVIVHGNKTVVFA